MIRFRSTQNDHPTSVPSRTTRHLATIEAARARHSLDDVARLASHGHFDRSPSLQLHLDDGIWHCIGCGQTGEVVERVCQSEGVGWRHAIRILSSACALAWAAHESSPSRRDFSSSRLPAGRCFATHAAVVEMTPDPVLLVTTDGPAL
jgi:hypothetical protein